MQTRPTLFFVTGAQRSGTTWLVELLNAHPEVKAAGEGWLLGGPAGVESWLDDAQIERWHRLPMAQGTWKNGLTAADVRRMALRGIVEAILLRGNPRQRAVGDKTPLAYLRRVDLLHELFPDAKVIVMVRDGRDVAVSHAFRALAEREFTFFASAREGERAAAYHLHGEGEARPLFTEPALRHYAGLWRECVRGGRRARELWGESCLEVRYERLLEDPSDVRRAFDLLGVRADMETVSACVAAADFSRTAGRERGAADHGAHRRKGVAGDWTMHFTDRGRAVYAEVAGPELAELGYESRG